MQQCCHYLTVFNSKQEKQGIRPQIFKLSPEAHATFVMWAFIWPADSKYTNKLWEGRGGRGIHKIKGKKKTYLSYKLGDFSYASGRKIMITYWLRHEQEWHLELGMGNSQTYSQLSWWKMGVKNSIPTFWDWEWEWTIQFPTFGIGNEKVFPTQLGKEFPTSYTFVG